VLITGGYPKENIAGVMPRHRITTRGAEMKRGNEKEESNYEQREIFTIALLMWFALQEALGIDPKQIADNVAEVLQTVPIPGITVGVSAAMPGMIRAMILFARDDVNGALLALHNATQKHIKTFLDSIGCDTRRTNFPGLLKLVEEHIDRPFEPSIKQTLLELNRLRNLLEHDPLAHSIRVKTDFFMESMKGCAYLAGYIDGLSEQEMEELISAFIDIEQGWQEFWGKMLKTKDAQRISN